MFGKFDEPTRLSLAFTTMANEEKSLHLPFRYETTYGRMYSLASREARHRGSLTS